jgi:hypothetical protein
MRDESGYLGKKPDGFSSLQNKEIEQGHQTGCHRLLSSSARREELATY